MGVYEEFFRGRPGGLTWTAEEEGTPPLLVWRAYSESSAGSPYAIVVRDNMSWEITQGFRSVAYGFCGSVQECVRAALARLPERKRVVDFDAEDLADPDGEDEAILDRIRELQEELDDLRQRAEQLEREREELLVSALRKLLSAK